MHSHRMASNTGTAVRGCRHSLFHRDGRGDFAGRICLWHAAHSIPAQRTQHCPRLNLSRNRTVSTPMKALRMMHLRVMDVSPPCQHELNCVQ
jgi:hypothetical protein